ncbi:hypothetical protein EYF80_035643 [Liparis tanakae]|uniref:Uncharacterized protein n=1 Tax=Liparis tanakae TaxID=230148 RepID=A0A4Z2GLI8_9TELE|nr:hypothetical protein EYF80_035643 [Liparis tanakae]
MQPHHSPPQAPPCHQTPRPAPLSVGLRGPAPGSNTQTSLGQSIFEAFQKPSQPVLSNEMRLDMNLGDTSTHDESFSMEAEDMKLQHYAQHFILKQLPPFIQSIDRSTQDEEEESALRHIPLLDLLGADGRSVLGRNAVWSQEAGLLISKWKREAISSYPSGKGARRGLGTALIGPLVLPGGTTQTDSGQTEENEASPTEIGLIELNYFMRRHNLNPNEHL